jgi:hypothetical protein
MKKHMFIETHTRPCGCGKGIETVTTKIDTLAGQKTVSTLTKCKKCGPSGGAIYVPIGPDKRPKKSVSEQMQRIYNWLKKNKISHKEAVDSISCDSGYTKKEIENMLREPVKKVKKKGAKNAI